MEIFIERQFCICNERKYPVAPLVRTLFCIFFLLFTSFFSILFMVRQTQIPAFTQLHQSHSYCLPFCPSTLSSPFSSIPFTSLYPFLISLLLLLPLACFAHCCAICVEHSISLATTISWNSFSRAPTSHSHPQPWLFLSSFSPSGYLAAS